MGRGKYSKGVRSMNRKVEQGKGLSCSFGLDNSKHDHKKGYRITKQEVKKLIAARHVGCIAGAQPMVAGKPTRKSKGDRIIMN